MEAGDSSPLAGAEIHGFRTAADLRIKKLMEDGATRWFRPNEVHAILSNYMLLKIQPQPIDNPTSGTILVFDRKMLRNFRKDGNNWKKKKDGKTVQEAHEKLKIGNEERIHVYYARSEDDPNFYRRCYWLLDKNLERIVLVHYRQTSEETQDNAFQHLPTTVECTDALALTNRTHHASPSTPKNSTSGSVLSELSGSPVMLEEINSREEPASYTGSGISQADNRTELWNHELSLHEINTLEWADLVEPPTSTYSAICIEGDASSSDHHMPNGNDGSFLSSNDVVEEVPSFEHPTDAINCNEVVQINHTNCGYFQAEKNQENPSPLFKTLNSTSQADDLKFDAIHSSASPDIFSGDVFLAQNSFGRWNCMNDESLGLLDDQIKASSSGDKSKAFTIMDQSLTPGQIFSIADFSPGWAYSTEETKVLVVGHFSEPYEHLIASNIYCVFGEMHAAAEMIQAGVYHCSAMPHPPGTVNFFMTLDGYTPISQVLSFDYRSAPSVQLNGGVTSSEDDDDKRKWKEFQVQTRLAHLLFSTTNNISIQSNRAQTKFLKEAKVNALVTSPLIEKDWLNLLTLSSSIEASHVPATGDLFELVLKSKLQEWLLEKVAEGCKTTDHDSQGQGAIHLCAILDYTWAVHLFSSSGMSLDFRDASGWTALHWAAYFKRENMVCALLCAGANPSLVTDPTPEFPGGCTAADFASKQGYKGMAAFLSGTGLIAHFQAMSLSGNITAPMPPGLTNQVSSEHVCTENLSEQELCQKESLAAYRNAMDAANCIQAALSKRVLKQQTKAVLLAKPEIEAAQLVAALKIQHALRNYSRRRTMRAAARIQSRFRTWKIRRNFLNLRKQTIKIQAAFRGQQVRRQYHKILWSVGVVEKAILRWRLKRKGLRGIQVESKEAMKEDTEEESAAEEEFFKVGREQAEERVKRLVIGVQAMFRSYRAQQEYRRMKKLTHEMAKLQFSGLDQRP